MKTASSNFLQSLFDLSGKTALVTGASGGIGEAFSWALAGAGAHVCLHGRDHPKLKRLENKINKSGGTCSIYYSDLNSVKNCRELIKKVKARTKRIDILVNCAGINRRSLIADFSEIDFDSVVDVNLKSLFFLSQAVYPLMKKQGGGKIINIGSITSSTALGKVSVYTATKGAVAQLTKSMAIEWAKDNIQVNCLAPGFIKTPLTAKPLWGNPRRRKWLLDRIPANRAGNPEDLVGTLLLLASGGSSYLTGQMITVDGGFLVGKSWDVED